MGNPVQIKCDTLAPEYAAKYEHPTNMLRVGKIRRLQLIVNYVQLIKPETTLALGVDPIGGGQRF